jgi:hypothetical protein
MRTKFILGVAAIAAGALSAVAQSNVYSLNVVGYINLPLIEGFNMVANQLDADGTGTNNTVTTVFGSSLPTNSQVFAWNGSAYSIASYTIPKGSTNASWNAAVSVNPGQGVWVKVPVGSGTQTVTTVGQVLQGTLVNPNLVAGGGFSLVSDQVPLAGTLTTTLHYNPTVQDQVFLYDPVAQSYSVFSYTLIKGTTNVAWGPTEPSIAVGQGFWLKGSAGATWNQTFNVQ